MNTPAATSSAIDALRRLTPAEIEDRLTELHSEDVALRTLLRSLRARDRARQRMTPRVPAMEVAAT